MKYAIAIDLGGTKTIVALIRNNRIIKKIKYPTSQKGKNKLIYDLMHSIELISENIKKSDIKAIIIGVPSPVDEKNGIVNFAPNINGFKNVKLKNIIENKINLPVYIENDVKLQALGEYSTNEDVNSFFYLALGTGVGAAFVDGGKAYSLEFGHTIIKVDGERCGCGNFGCLESYISGRGITNRFYKKYKKRLIPSEILVLAKKGNKNAKEFLKETGFYLGIGITNAINTFNPGLIIINGGVTNLRDYILKNAKKTVSKNKIIKFKGNIITSNLQEDALFYGANWYLKKFDNRNIYKL